MGVSSCWNAAGLPSLRSPVHRPHGHRARVGPGSRGHADRPERDGRANPPAQRRPSAHAGACHRAGGPHTGDVVGSHLGAAPRDVLEALLSHIADAVYLVGADGRIGFVNPAARAVLGYAEEEPLDP